MSLKYDSLKKKRKERNKWKKQVSSPEELEAKEIEFVQDQLKHDEPSIKGQVRIIAGKAKGIKIDIPRGSRPVTDRIKTTIFDLLREDISQRTVLDLYAGSGSFGLEALSRGADRACFVDATKHAERAILRNVRSTGFLMDTEVIRSKVEDYLPLAISGGEQYEVIFIDPPFKIFNTKDTTKMKSLMNLIKQLLPGYIDWETKLYKGVVIMKHPRRYPITELEIEGLRVHETLDFGRNSVSFFAVDNEG